MQAAKRVAGIGVGHGGCGGGGEQPRLVVEGHDVDVGIGGPSVVLRAESFRDARNRKESRDLRSASRPARCDQIIVGHRHAPLQKCLRHRGVNLPPITIKEHAVPGEGDGGGVFEECRGIDHNTDQDFLS